MARLVWHLHESRVRPDCTRPDPVSVPAAYKMWINYSRVAQLAKGTWHVRWNSETCGVCCCHFSGSYKFRFVKYDGHSRLQRFVKYDGHSRLQHTHFQFRFEIRHWTWCSFASAELSPLNRAIYYFVKCTQRLLIPVSSLCDEISGAHLRAVWREETIQCYVLLCSYRGLLTRTTRCIAASHTSHITTKYCDQKKKTIIFQGHRNKQIIKSWGSWTRPVLLTSVRFRKVPLLHSAKFTFRISSHSFRSYFYSVPSPPPLSVRMTSEFHTETMAQRLKLVTDLLVSRGITLRFGILLWDVLKSICSIQLGLPNL
jgi:hypothetical protein